MSLREKASARPRLAMTVGVMLCAGAGIAIALQIRAAAHARYPAGPGRNFYTVDDGATWFTESAAKVAPFDYGGKQAVRAHVFESANGSDEWIQYLEKYSDQAKQELELVRAGSKPSVVTTSGLMAGPLVKAPGGKKWVKQSDPAGRKIMKATSPDGDAADSIKEVTPP